MRPDELKRQRRAEAGATVVANLKHDHDLIAWAKATGRYLRIDRRTKWGNPYVIGKDGNREEVLGKYLNHIVASGLMPEPEETQGKVLACWCYPLRCHGDEIIEALGQKPATYDLGESGSGDSGL